MIKHISSKLYVVICSFILNGPQEVFFFFFFGASQQRKMNPNTHSER